MRSLVMTSAALLLITGCGSGSGDESDEVPTVNASVTVELKYPLADAVPNDSDEECFGRLDYSEIANGTGVTLYDASDKVVATGELTGGSGSCTWRADFYKVETADDFLSAEIAGWKSRPVEVDQGAALIELSADRDGLDRNWSK